MNIKNFFDYYVDFKNNIYICNILAIEIKDEFIFGFYGIINGKMGIVKASILNYSLVDFKLPKLI